MKFRIFPFLIAVAVIMASSCKKKDDPDPAPAKSKTELISQANWKLKVSTVNPAYDYDNDGNASTDIYAQMLPCEKDDFIKLDGTNKTVTYDEGATKCNPGDPQSSTFQWAWNANESKVIVSYMGVTVNDLTMTIVQLDDNTLKVTRSDGTYTYTETFGH